MKEITYIMVVFSLLSLAYVNRSLAQQGVSSITEVRGRTIDVDGNAVPDVSIRSAAGNVMAGQEGQFSVPVMERDTIYFTKVGFRPQRVLFTAYGAGRELVVVMEASMTELEVVEIHTGYQRLAAHLANGSYAVVGQDELNRSADPNILKRLDGIVNGLTFQIGRSNNNPQNKTNITIRGYGTIEGPLDPLIVVDDFVYEGNIDNINPNDVERVTILKDAEATSIYGARGGNGVIVLTMKKGRSDGKISIDMDQQVSIGSKPDLMRLPQMHAKDYIEVEEFLFSKGYFNNDLNSSRFVPVTPIVDQLDQLRSGRIDQTQYDTYKAGLMDNDIRRSYSELFLSPQIQSQSGMRLSGSSRDYRWNLSSNFNRRWTEATSQTDRLSFRMSHQFNIFEAIDLTLGASYSSIRSHSGNHPALSALQTINTRQVVPYLEFLDKDGKEIPFTVSLSKRYLDTIGQGMLKDWFYYPLSDIDHLKNSNSVEELLANVGIDWQVFKGLKLGVKYQHQVQHSEISRRYDEESYYVRDQINRFAEVDHTKRTVNYIYPLGDYKLESISKQSSYNFRGQLDYQYRDRLHYISTFVGGEARQINNGGHQWYYFGYVEDPLTFVTINPTQRFPIRPIGSATLGGSSQESPSNFHRFVSLYGKFTYQLLEKYSVSATVRKEGANIFGAGTNEKWKPLWSVGWGYDLLKEDFFSTSLLDQLRIKGSYGFSGNVDLSRMALPIAAYATNSAADGGLPYAQIGTLNNPQLRWEKVGQFNLGVDYGLFNGKLSGSIEYYIKRGRDLYGITPYDYSAWGRASTIKTNVASMDGRGLDLSVRVGGYGTSKLKMSSSLIYNYNLNKTREYYATSKDNPLYRVISGIGSISPIAGMPFYPVVAYSWAGLDVEGHPQVLLSGKPASDYRAVTDSARNATTADSPLRYVGSSIPKHTGSLFHSFRLGSFSLSANITYRLGYYFRRPSINYTALVQQGAGHPDYADRWQRPGDEMKTDVPSFMYPLPPGERNSVYLLSDLLIEKGDHLRLQNISFSYDYIWDRQRGRRLNLHMSMANLGIIWRANGSGLDPDYPYVVRPVRELNVGLRANF